MATGLNPKFIITECTIIHDVVDEVYEAMMDGEDKEAIKALDNLAEKARELKADILNKDK